MKGNKKPQNLPSNYVTLVQLEERWRIKQNDEQQQQLETRRPSNYLTLAQLQERWEQRHQKDKQQQDQHQQQQQQQQQGDEKQKKSKQQQEQQQQQQGDETPKPRQKQEKRNVDNRRNYPRRKNRNFAESSSRARPEENDAVEVVQGKNEHDAAVAVTVEGNESGTDNVKEKSKDFVRKRNRKKKKKERREKDKMIKDGEVRAQEQGEVTVREAHAPPIKSPMEEYVPVKRNEIRRDVTPAFKPKIDSVVEIEPKLGVLSLGEDNHMPSETQNRTVNRTNSGYSGYKSRYNGYNRSNFGHRGNHGGFSGRNGPYRGGPTKVNGFMPKDSGMVWVKKGEVANGAEDTRHSKELE